MDQIRLDLQSNLNDRNVQNGARLHLSSASSSPRPSSSAQSPSGSNPPRSSRLPVRSTSSSPRPASSLSPSQPAPRRSLRLPVRSTSSSTRPSSSAPSPSRSDRTQSSRLPVRSTSSSPRPSVEDVTSELEEKKSELRAAGRRIAQLENENRTLQHAAAEREAREEAARDRAAEFQTRNGALTRENHTLRRQVETLRNRQNELQQQNNNLEAQRRGEVNGLLLAILITRQVLGNVLIYQGNEMRRQQNIALRRHAQMSRRNERLVQALELANIRHEEEIALLLYQMTKPCERADSLAEVDPAPLPEAHPPAVSKTPKNDWRRPFDRYPQPRTRRSLRSVRFRKKMGERENLYYETRTRGGPWHQPNASRYAQQYPDSKVGRDVRVAQFTST